MFMSKDMFDEDGGSSRPNLTLSSSTSNLTRPVSSSSSSSSMLPPTSSPRSTSSQSSTFSSSQSITLSAYDDAGQALTPAMRKAKMEELRLQQLGKRKGRMLVPTVTAKNDRPTTAASLSSLSSLPASTTPTQGTHTRTATPSVPLKAQSTAYSSLPHRSTALSLVDPPDGDEKDSPPHSLRSPHPLERDMIAAGIAPIFDPNPSASSSSSAKALSSASSSASSALSSFPSPSPGSAFSLSSLTPLSLRVFLTAPCSPHHHHQCYITRNKKGFANRLFPLYEAIYETGAVPIMASRKKSKNKTSNYTISSSKEHLDKANEETLGKVRSNFVGTEFSVFDDGANPDKGDKNKEKRAELGVVLYESNILGSRGPRKMTVLIPAVKQNKEGKQLASVHRPASTAVDDSLLAVYKGVGGPEKVTALVNKTPKWNEQVGAYVLNFNGRVTMASVKNFQLMVHQGEAGDGEGEEGEAGDEERPCLQFGRVGKDMFTMDFGWPLSPLQAFSICLSSFDYKLACE